MMILQPCNVELTKVYYYDQNKRSHNMSVSTISRETYQNSFNKNSIIKKNIFGQRWILKINETEDLKKKKKCSLKMCAYVFVFCSLILAVGFGIFYSIDHNIFRTENRNTPNDESTMNYLYLDMHNTNNTVNTNVEMTTSDTSPTQILNFTSENKLEQSKANLTKFYCNDCAPDEICMKIEETAKPECIKVADRRDPTGCGGLCKINIEYCKNLDKLNHIFQCLQLKTLLKCPQDTFNCGDMCIMMRKRCDGKNDCLNMVDEMNCECDLVTHFHCGNGTSCLEKGKMCDGKVDCWDRSDETECQKSIHCEENYIPCLDGECIPKEKLCNKVFDCHDKSDEPAWCQLLRKA